MISEGGGDGSGGEVPNRYRAGLVSAATHLAAIEHDVAAVFDAAVATMRAGAWEGRAATMWFGELQARQTTTSRVSRQVCEACRAAAAAQPEVVAAGDWRARWAPVPGPVPRMW